MPEASKSLQLLASEGQEVRRGSPLPPDSPLLSKSPASPQLQRARQIHRELSRARHFRASRESSRHGSRQGSRQGSRCSTPARGSRASSPSRDQPAAASCNGLVNKSDMTGEMCFAVQPAPGGRKGWIIMPDDPGSPIPRDSSESDPDALQRVVEMIREMELSGHAVPDRITVKV